MKQNRAQCSSCCGNAVWVTKWQIKQQHAESVSRGDDLSKATCRHEFVKLADRLLYVWLHCGLASSGKLKKNQNIWNQITVSHATVNWGLQVWKDVWYMNKSFSQTLFTLELQSYQGTCDFSSNCPSFILEADFFHFLKEQLTIFKKTGFFSVSVWHKKNKFIFISISWLRTAVYSIS